MTWRATAEFEEWTAKTNEIIRSDATPLIQEFKFFLWKMERKRHPWRRRPIKKWG
jgi:hypothetical protein